MSNKKNKNAKSLEYWKDQSADIKFKEVTRLIDMTLKPGDKTRLKEALFDKKTVIIKRL